MQYLKYNGSEQIDFSAVPVEVELLHYIGLDLAIATYTYLCEQNQNKYTHACLYMHTLPAHCLEICMKGNQSVLSIEQYDT